MYVSVVWKALAEEVEKGGNKGQAAELYGQAAQLFEAENSTSEASKCRQKVAVWRIWMRGRVCPAVSGTLPHQRSS